jgi:predicted nuclease with TOPRIM domain
MMCAYEPIKEYLEIQKENEASLKRELKRLYKENEGLRRQQLDSKHQVEFITNQLDLMFPGHFLTDPDIPEDARNESLLSENQRINNELETLTANLKSLELKQNMALMSETFRLQEELQSLRAICHGMRMQMHYLMMERRGTTPGSNNASSSENNPNGAANSLDRMRTWLGKI